MILGRKKIYQPLRDMIDTKMPELSAALAPLRLDAVRQVLNAMTGLDIQPSESVEQTTMCAYHELAEMETAGTLLTEALPKGMAEAKRIIELYAWVAGAH